MIDKFSIESIVRRRESLFETSKVAKRLSNLQLYRVIQKYVAVFQEGESTR